MSGIIDRRTYPAAVDRLHNYYSIIGVAGTKHTRTVSPELALVPSSERAEARFAFARLEAFLDVPGVTPQTVEKAKWLIAILQAELHKKDPKLETLGRINCLRIKLENAHPAINKAPYFATLKIIMTAYSQLRVSMNELETLHMSSQDIDSQNSIALATKGKEIAKKMLPADIWKLIAEYLTGHEIVLLGRVCKVIRAAILDPSLWIVLAKEMTRAPFFSSFPKRAENVTATEETTYAVSRRLFKELIMRRYLKTHTILKAANKVCSTLSTCNFSYSSNDFYEFIEEKPFVSSHTNPEDVKKHFHVVQGSKQVTLHGPFDSEFICVGSEIWKIERCKFRRPLTFSRIDLQSQESVESLSFPHITQDFTFMATWGSTIYLLCKTIYAFDCEKKTMTELPGQLHDGYYLQAMGGFLFHQLLSQEIAIYEMGSFTKPLWTIPGSKEYRFLTATQSCSFVRTSPNTIACFDTRVHKRLASFVIDDSEHPIEAASVAYGSLFVSVKKKLYVFDLLTGKRVTTMDIDSDTSLRVDRYRLYIGSALKSHLDENVNIRTFPLL